MKPRPAGDRFLGVRLDDEDLASLDRFASERGIASRSEAVRRLVRDAGRAPAAKSPPTGERGVAVTLPSALYLELQRAVENGWSTSVEAALEKALERGQETLAERRPRRMELDRQTANHLAREEAERRKASQESDRRSGP